MPEDKKYNLIIAFQLCLDGCYNHNCIDNSNIDYVFATCFF